MTKKTNDPELVDICLTNNPKLTAALTSYQNVLNIFPMESLISYTNNYNKHVHDPVTAEKEFYVNLNNQDELAVKLEYIDNPDIGDTSSESSPGEDIFKEEEYWEDKSITYEAVKENIYSDEPNYPWQLPGEKRAEEANLKSMLDIRTQFILFWVEKFRCIHETVKSEIFSEIPKDTEGGLYNKDNVYFNNFNESLFHLRDHIFIKDRTTNTLIDVENHKGSPSIYNKCQMNNLDPDTYDTAEELIRKSTLKFKSNIKNIAADLKKDEKYIQMDVKYPDTNTGPVHASIMTEDSIYLDPDTSSSHGNNLVPDDKHPGRIENNLEAVQAKMVEILGDMKRVFDFLDKNTRENTEEWGKYKRFYFVEGVFMQVDQFANELKAMGTRKPLSTRSNQLLS